MGVKRKCRRLPTLSRRRSGSFWNGIKSITVLNYIIHNDLGSIMLSVLELSTGGVPLCASAKSTFYQKYLLAPVGKLSSAKISWSCANIIVAKRPHCQVNNSDPKPTQPSSPRNKKACTVAGLFEEIM